MTAEPGADDFSPSEEVTGPAMKLNGKVDASDRDSFIAKIFLGFAAATFTAVLQLITIRPLTLGFRIAIYAFAVSLPVNLLYGLAMSSEYPDRLTRGSLAYLWQIGPYLAVVGFVSLFFTLSEAAGYIFLAMSLLCIVIFVRPYVES